jgi:hypothetical protein
MGKRSEKKGLLSKSCRSRKNTSNSSYYMGGPFQSFGLGAGAGVGSAVGAGGLGSLLSMMVLVLCSCAILAGVGVGSYYTATTYKDLDSLETKFPVLNATISTFGATLTNVFSVCLRSNPVLFDSALAFRVA